MFLRKWVAVAALWFLSVTPAAAAIDALIDQNVKPVADLFSGIIFTAIPFTFGGQDYEVPALILWLMAIGIFTTFYFRFINLRLFGLAVQLLNGKYQAQDRKEGQISNWQALSTSLSGTVGLGNIAGVAVAISIGGPGATFWMIVMGFLGMTTKFAECTLGVKYREISQDGEVSGGPMYYLRRGLADRGWPLAGKALAIFFAVCCIGGSLGGGNMFQSNQSYGMFMRLAGEGNFFADKAWLFGICLAVLTGVVIIGGIQSIAKASEKIFPAMAGLYLLACLIVIGANVEALPQTIANIFEGAFSASAVGGGLIGALIAGVRRAVFSNEAGCGSAPITHAAVKSDSHITQGLIAMLNPFIDTVVICTVTALTIGVTGVYASGVEMEGIDLTARAFATAGDWMVYVLGLCVFLFAYSTLISWYYLGEKAFTFLAGRSRAKVMGFKIAYCIFVVIGAAADLTNVINLTDALFFAMALPNVFILYVMAPEIRRDLQAYMDNLKSLRA